MKDIILAGIQASGKGTQAQKLRTYFGNACKYFETGGILRALQSQDNAIGNYLKHLTTQGFLVKDEIVSGLFAIYLETLSDTDIILADGCFRRIQQTQLIFQQLINKQRDFVVIELTIPEQEVYLRLKNRRICKKCGTIYSFLLHGTIKNCLTCGGELYVRDDDSNISSINTRISAYQQETIPALQRINHQGYLKKIDGTQSIDTIFEEILKILGN